MSVNIYITGTQDCVVIKTGKKFVNTVMFSAIQTPTHVTYAILDAEDKAQAYIDWVLSHGEDEQVPIYTEEDIFGRGEPIGWQTYNYCKEHVAEFKEWMELMKKEEFDVNFGSI